jgi:putative transposase
MKYKLSSTCAYNLGYHIVWTPKYRRSVLVGEVEERLKQLLQDKSLANDYEIKAMEIMPDHVHLFISASPTVAPQKIVNELKGYTSNKLRTEFEDLRTKLPTLWSRSYYIGSIGFVSESVVKTYISGQKGK